jgi:hypothetical protein
MSKLFFKIETELFRIANVAILNCKFAVQTIEMETIMRKFTLSSLTRIKKVNLSAARRQPLCGAIDQLGTQSGAVSPAFRLTGIFVSAIAAAAGLSACSADAVAQTAPATPSAICRAVGGTMLINLIDQTTGLGVVSGDLSAAIRGTTLSQSNGANGAIVQKLAHVLILTGGGRINTNDDDSVLTPVPGQTNQVHVALKHKIVGGTGQYANATGSLDSVGAADFATGALVLRYSGKVCAGA